jgi:pyruvate dehydrogenase E1 component alpha subunit
MGYRAECDFFEWKGRCPIENFKERLMKDGLISPRDNEEMVKEISTEFDAAITYAKNSSFPEEKILLEHIYAD